MDITGLSSDLQKALTAAKTSKDDIEKADKALKAAQEKHAGAAAQVQELHRKLQEAVSSVVPVGSPGGKRIG
jgi:peptidoglycan hydrolase CwlO-like protein